MFKNKEGKIRSGWKIAAMMGTSLAAVMVISVIITIGFFAILVINGDVSMNFPKMDFTERGQQWMNGLNIVMMFIQEVVFILTPVIAWKFIMKQPLAKMGLTPLKRNQKELVVGILLGILSMSLVFAALVITGFARVDSWKPHFSVLQLIYLVIFILVGFAEEIYSRGFTMSVLRQTKSKVVIFLVSSTLFALMHSTNPGIGMIPYLNLTLVGILFAFMYFRSGNLWMCIGYHITWNYFQGYVYGFKVSGLESDGILTTVPNGSSLINGGDFGPEGGLFVTAVILLGIGFVLFFYKNNKFEFMSVLTESGMSITGYMHPNLELGNSETNGYCEINKTAEINNTSEFNNTSEINDTSEFNDTSEINDNPGTDV